MTSPIAEPAEPDPNPLDNPAFAALNGPHKGIAERFGTAVRYPADISPFLALPADPGPADWADLAGIVGPGETVTFAVVDVDLAPGWSELRRIDGVQLVDDHVDAAPDHEAVALGAADVPDMLALVERTQPGPFRPRTIELGGYLGIRREGRLVAMAGERMRPPGWSEISAVCTDAEFRGQGLAARLVRAVAAGIRQRGDTPFIQAAATNVGAVRLYEALGFRMRREVAFTVVRSPGRVPVAER